MAFHYKKRSAEAVDKRASQQGGDFQGFILDEYRTYTPKKGDNFIRILPPTWDDAEHYGMDVWVHYGIGPDRASLICTAKMNSGERCPLCEARAKAEKSGDDELANELKPARRVLVWILDRKEEDKGPLLWAMPWTLDRDIAKVSRDRQSGELYLIDHPDEGYDVSFDREGEGMNIKYTGVQLARRPSSVDEEWLEYIQERPVPETLRWRDYEEMQALYAGSGMDAEKSSGRDADRRDAPSERRSSREETRREPEPRRTREAPREEPRSNRREEPPAEDEKPWDDEPAAEEEQPPREERVQPRGRRPVDPPREEPRREERTASSAPSGRSRAEELRQRFSARK